MKEDGKLGENRTNRRGLGKSLKGQTETSPEARE